MNMIKDSKLSNIKSNLKRIRIIKGYTQDGLAQLSNVNIKSITAYEQNPEKLISASVSTIYKLADALGCEMEDIINKEEIKEGE